MVLECPNCGTKIDVGKNTCPVCPVCGFRGCDEWILEGE